MERVAALLRDRRGVTALEYGMLSAIVVIALMSVLNPYSGHLYQFFLKIGELSRYVT
jgi:Flp pilus assembly pilin Flp